MLVLCSCKRDPGKCPHSSGVQCYCCRPASPLATSSPAKQMPPARSASARRCATTDAPAGLAEGVQLAGTALTSINSQRLEEPLSSHAGGAVAALCTQQRRVTSASGATEKATLATPQHHQQPCRRGKASVGPICSPAPSGCQAPGTPEQLVQHAEAGPLEGMGRIAAGRRHSNVAGRGMLRKQQLSRWRPGSNDCLRDHGDREAVFELVGTSKAAQQPSAGQPGQRCPPNSVGKNGMQRSKLLERTAHRTEAADGIIKYQLGLGLQVQGSQLDHTFIKQNQQSLSD